VNEMIIISNEEEEEHNVAHWHMNKVIMISNEEEEKHNVDVSDHVNVNEIAKKIFIWFFSFFDVLCLYWIFFSLSLFLQDVERCVHWIQCKTSHKRMNELFARRWNLYVHLNFSRGITFTRRHGI
jgi:hypothetical protein